MNSCDYILMDVEGTTTDLLFVKEVLFPYSEKYLEDFLMAQGGIYFERLSELLPSTHPDNFLGASVKLLQGFIQQDIKHPLLKEIQGKMWEEGYAQGVYQGHVYPDVPLAFRRWRKEGMTLGIYSSGSVLAQQLLFKYSLYGDLTPLLTNHFDLQVGGKREKSSFELIAKKLNLLPSRILFLSDVPEELYAAQKAGLQVCQLLRPGVKPAFDLPSCQDFHSLPAQGQEKHLD